MCIQHGDKCLYAHVASNQLSCYTIGSDVKSHNYFLKKYQCTQLPFSSFLQGDTELNLSVASCDYTSASASKLKPSQLTIGSATDSRS